MWDGSGWSTFTRDGLPGPVFVDGIPELIAAGDGSVWAASGRSLVRFQAGEVHDVSPLEGSVSLRAVGDDGRRWFVREDCDSCGVQIVVDDGSTVATYDAEDGLPGPGDTGWEPATVLPRDGDVLAATGAGMYRLTDGSWRRLDLSPRSGSDTPGSRWPDGRRSLAALSRTEAWVAVQRFGTWDDAPQSGGLFRFDSAAWHEQRLPVESTLGRAVVAPDGALWVATDAGPLVRRNGAWIDLGDTIAAAVPDPGEADARCGGAVFIAGNGVAYYAGARSGGRLVALRLVGSAWGASLIPAPAPGLCSEALAATADGTIWLLEGGVGQHPVPCDR